MCWQPLAWRQDWVRRSQQKHLSASRLDVPEWFLLPASAELCLQLSYMMWIKKIDWLWRSEVCASSPLPPRLLFLQGHHFPRFTQNSVTLSPSLLHLFPWDLTIVLQALLLSPRASWLAESVRNSIQLQIHTFIWRCGSINRRDVTCSDQILTAETSAAQPWCLLELQRWPNHRSNWLWLTR